mmetsp:Transcript_30663/g.106004  ORF Transcript_30663/g.106004 Transcript_30663/m.106004 type:complete len:201 (-) Transcript_30663:446-1048(-)
MTSLLCIPLQGLVKPAAKNRITRTASPAKEAKSSSSAGKAARACAWTVMTSSFCKQSTAMQRSPTQTAPPRGPATTTKKRSDWPQTATCRRSGATTTPRRWRFPRAATTTPVRHSSAEATAAFPSRRTNAKASAFRASSAWRRGRSSPHLRARSRTSTSSGLARGSRLGRALSAIVARMRRLLPVSKCCHGGQIQTSHGP